MLEKLTFSSVFSTNFGIFYYFSAWTWAPLYVDSDCRKTSMEEPKVMNMMKGSHTDVNYLSWNTVIKVLESGGGKYKEQR